LKGRNDSGRPRHIWKDNISMALGEIRRVGKCGQDACGTLARPCEHGNEILDSIKDEITE